MNKLAQELNATLAGTSIHRLLSDFGKRFYFPKGIASQSAEASRHAHMHNATIGMAFSAGQPMMLPSVSKYLRDLNPTEAVSYAPNGGDAELRELWEGEIRKKNPSLANIETSTPLVVPGLTNGVSQLADLFADPTDAVFIADMFWGNYRLIFEERKQARLVTFPLFDEAGHLAVDEMRKTIQAHSGGRKAIVVLNFPNNPTGYAPTVDEANAVVSALRELAEAGLTMLVITDDAYFGLFYEQGVYTESLFSQLASCHQNVLAAKVDGPTKEEFVWGFRIGFVTFGGVGLTSAHYEALEKKMLGAIRSSISNSSRPAQSILKKALRVPTAEAEKKERKALLEKRYRRVREIVQQHGSASILRALPFNSGYFMTFECPAGTAEALRLELLQNRGIGTISIQDRYLRVTYSAIEEEKLESLYSEIYAAAERVTAGSSHR